MKSAKNPEEIRTVSSVPASLVSFLQSILEGKDYPVPTCPFSWDCSSDVDVERQGTLAEEWLADPALFARMHVFLSDSVESHLARQSPQRGPLPLTGFSTLYLANLHNLLWLADRLPFGRSLDFFHKSRIDDQRQARTVLHQASRSCAALAGDYGKLATPSDILFAHFVTEPALHQFLRIKPLAAKWFPGPLSRETERGWRQLLGFSPLTLLVRIEEIAQDIFAKEEGAGATRGDAVQWRFLDRALQCAEFNVTAYVRQHLLDALLRVGLTAKNIVEAAPQTKTLLLDQQGV